MAEESNFIDTALYPDTVFRPTTKIVFTTTDNQTLLSIDTKTGKIWLNPDIPQDEATKRFMQAINQLAGSEIYKTTCD